MGYIFQPNNYINCSYNTTPYKPLILRFSLFVHNAVQKQTGETIEIVIISKFYLPLFYTPFYFKKVDIIEYKSRSPPYEYCEVRYG